MENYKIIADLSLSFNIYATYVFSMDYMISIK